MWWSWTSQYQSQYMWTWWALSKPGNGNLRFSSQWANCWLLPNLLLLQQQFTFGRIKCWIHIFLIWLIHSILFFYIFLYYIFVHSLGSLLSLLQWWTVATSGINKVNLFSAQPVMPQGFEIFSFLRSSSCHFLKHI